jgi:hypothetical protein
MSAADITASDAGLTLSRDALLRSAAAGALSVGAVGLVRGPAARLLAAPAPAAPAPAGPLSRETWAQHVGSRVRIVGADGTRLSVRLDDVRDLPGAPAGASDAFALALRGARDRGLAGGTYTVVHSRVGRHELFLTPVGRGKKGQDYEIIVNRTTPRPGRSQGGTRRHG